MGTSLYVQLRPCTGAIKCCEGTPLYGHTFWGDARATFLGGCPDSYHTTQHLMLLKTLKTYICMQAATQASVPGAIAVWPPLGSPPPASANGVAPGMLLICPYQPLGVVLFKTSHLGVCVEEKRHLANPSMQWALLFLPLPSCVDLSHRCA